MGLFKSRGFKDVNEEMERQEERKKGGLFRFFLSKSKDEAEVTFLTEQPINYYEHNLKTVVNGKDRYEQIPCIGEGCKHCANGERPSFKSAWLIVDHREYTYEKDGKEVTAKDQVRLLIYGVKQASQLDRKSERYGLVGRDYTVVRLGTGTSTTYTWEHGDKNPLTEAEIRNYLPDGIADMYDGTMESLYKIVENQIEAMAGLNNSSSSNTKEDKEADRQADEALVNIDDDRTERSSKPQGGSKSIKKLLKNKKK